MSAHRDASRGYFRLPRGLDLPTAQRWLAADPGQPALRMGIARALYEGGDKEEALVEFREALRLYEVNSEHADDETTRWHAVAHLDFAKVLHELGLLDEALRHEQRANVLLQRAGSPDITRPGIGPDNRGSAPSGWRARLDRLLRRR